MRGRIVTTLQRTPHSLGVAGNDREIGAGGLVGFRAALLPIEQRAERDAVTSREFFLSQP